MSSPHQAMTIAAVIPAFNVGPYLARALDSVLGQTCPPDEIIVVDDGSTDNTAEVARRYGDRIRYLHQANGGSCNARNHGILAARSEWIAFLDGDDEWTPRRLELQKTVLTRNPHLNWITGNFTACSCQTNRQAPGHDPAYLDRLLGGRDQFDSYFEAFSRQATGWTGCYTVRKSALIDAGLFTPGQKNYDDIDLWFRVAIQNPTIGFINQPMGTHHLDIPNSITRRYTDPTFFYDMFDRHLKHAADHGQSQSFAPCAALMLTARLRSLLFDGRYADMRQLLSRYRRQIPAGFALAMRLLTLWPWASGRLCRSLSWANRTFKFRKTIARSGNLSASSPSYTCQHKSNPPRACP